MTSHWFWLALVVSVVAWYSTVTVYVGIRGALDIRQMLARLGTARDRDRTEER